MKPTRWLATALLLTAALQASPAAAGSPVSTSLQAHATAASFKVLSVIEVSGSVQPRSLKQVTLERLVDTKWLVVGHAKPTSSGTFALLLRAPKVKSTLALRVVRAGSSTAKAAISHTLAIHVVAGAFTVTATSPSQLVAGQPTVVTGKVTPKSRGTVVLEALSGKTWVTVVGAKLTASSTFSLSSTQGVGSHRLRVAKAASATVAAGDSAGLTVTVLPLRVAPPVTVTPPLPVPLSVATSVLPEGTVGLTYTGQLIAVGGTAPYAWSVQTGTLPVGLSVSPSGAVSGLPALAATTTFPVAVTDAAGNAAAGSVSLRLSLSPSAANTVMAWGASSAIGNGSNANSNVPVAVSGVVGATSVVGGGFAGYSLRFDGTVRAWGDNTFKELGNGVVSSEGVSAPVAGLAGVTALGAGVYTGYAVEADGTAWAYGDNSEHQLGIGAVLPTGNPVQIHNLTGIRSITGTAFSGLALTTSGAVWGWGLNSSGEVGDGTQAPRTEPVPAVGLSNVVAIAGGNQEGFALEGDGTVWAWGAEFRGALGDGQTASGVRLTPARVGTLTGITAIADGHEGTVYALSSSGTVWAWGEGDQGQIGNGGTSDAPSPVQVSGLSDVVAIAAGATSGYALTATGTVLAWGSDGHGELGDGHNSTQSSPVQVTGLSHVVSIAAGGLNAYAVVSG